ncbi:MAG: arginine--tRNA ligase [Candidatus Pacebacteria bacterium]|nr:arginine--tRNA ligase [Candidatus Paceibacterota bacterium]
MDIKLEIENLIKESLKKIDIGFLKNIEIVHPDILDHGDYTCNIAMILAKKENKNPRELAEQIKAYISNHEYIEKIEIAGSGFINFYLSKKFYQFSLKEIFEKKENWGKNQILRGKVFLAEHTDPNLFKEIHAGHLMTNAIGESIYRIAGFSDADTKNITFQGDVGLHIAKAIWGIKNIGEELPKNKIPFEKQKFLGQCYVFGEKNFSENEDVKNNILKINKNIYTREDDEQNKIYDLGCKWSLEYLETIYKLLGSKFDYYFLESETFKDGQRIVEENIGKIFKKSNGAIIFEGSKYGLHDRVFINSEGLPTYEAKDIGLFYKKWEKYNPDISMTVTGSEQEQYFEIVQKAGGMINSEWEEKTVHLAHGKLKLSSGKMSSREGKIIRAQEWINSAIESIIDKMKDREIDEESVKEISKKIAIAGIKYSILKVSAGKDIVYDEKKALDFAGNSGPYLQYSYVRANSILKKVEEINLDISVRKGNISGLEKLIYRFPEEIKKSLKFYSSHYIANYLYELASEFNFFYGNTKILDKNNEDYFYNLVLVKSFAQTIKNGLYLLGIETVDKM